MKTNCKGCIFAEYTGGGIVLPGEGKIRQHGCSLHMLQRFAEKGIKVERKLNKEDETLYFEIDTICRNKRGQKWGEKHEYNERQDVLEFENKLSHSYVVYGKNREFSLDELRITLDSISSQTMKPPELMVIIGPKQKVPAEELGKTEIRWNRIQSFENVEPDIVIYEQLKHLNSKFYTVVEPGFVVPQDFSSSLNSYFNNDFGQFQMLEPTDDSMNGRTCYAPTHYLFGTYENIKKECDEQKCPEMVKKVNEVYKEWQIYHE